jgi:hypothetical protein
MSQLLSRGNPLEPTKSPIFQKLEVMTPFKPRKGYDATTAVTMMEASFLAYGDEKLVKTRAAASGFRDVEGNPGAKFYSNTSTQAFLMVKDDAIIVAFRGTENGNRADMRADLDVRRAKGPLGADVHRGFNDALNEIFPELVADLKKLQAEGARPIYVTGHSLGGALATVATPALAGKGVPVAGTYTYGAPQVGWTDFAQKYDAAHGASTFRHSNQNDVVTQLLVATGLTHVASAQERYFGQNGKVSVGASVVSKLGDKQAGIAANLQANWVQHLPGPKHLDMVVDHAPDAYYLNVRQAAGLPLPAGVEELIAKK